jgi:glycosyltransferase involved in cell wall biosynthesis
MIKNLTVIIPAYNEEEGIRNTIISLYDSIKEKKLGNSDY